MISLQRNFEATKNNELRVLNAFICENLSISLDLCEECEHVIVQFSAKIRKSLGAALLLHVFARNM